MGSENNSLSLRGRRRFFAIGSCDAVCLKVFIFDSTFDAILDVTKDAGAIDL